MNAASDPLDDLERWIAEMIEDDLEVLGELRKPEPIGFMTVYDDSGRVVHGNKFEDRDVADNAMAMMKNSGMMKPLFRVNIYPPRSRQADTQG